MGLKIRHTYLIIIALGALAVSSCKSTRFVEEGEYLLTKNKVEVKGRSVSESEIERLLKPKPNRKYFGLLRFNLFVWNLFDSEKLEAANEKKRRKLEEKNEKRAEKGKEKKEFKPVLRHRIRGNIGEPPVLLDTNLVKNSVKNTEKYLKNNGFFNAETRYELKIDSSAQKVAVIYHITTKKPYRIKDVAYSIDDPELIPDVKKAVKGTLLKNGEIFKITDVDKERDRLTKAMRNQGYFYFNQNYVTYEVDSTIGDHRVHIRQVINNPVERAGTKTGKDSLVTLKHRKFIVENVYINPYYSAETETDFGDTLHHDEMIFTNSSQLLFKPGVLTNAVFIKPGEYYNQDNQEYTYNRLSALNNFRFINISFERAGDDTNTINCTINLMPVIKQSTAAEVEGTNTGGNLGISGNLSYTNRNTFRAAEVLSIRLRGGLEAQQTNAPIAGEQGEGDRSRLDEYTPFNTLEYGVETSITLPDLLVPKRVSDFKLPKYNKPKTALNLSFNHQNRPDFTRNFFNASYAYYWSGSSRHQTDYSLYPVNVSLINIDRRPFFEQRLRELNNEFLNNTYSDHFIAGSKFSFTRTNQNVRKRLNNYWNRVFIETAGNTLALAHDLAGAPKVEDTYYKTLGIRFAQFVKVSNDLRFYRNISKGSKMVYRFYTGMGVSYNNLNVLPFDKSFFVGGANDIRAWVARSLGPGSSSPELGGVNQVGDIILETNVEYRAKLTDLFELALFTDIGNIWLMDRPEVDPKAVFEIDRFYNELAVGSGVGFRFDILGFLLLRFDLGFQIKDPALPEDERWLFQSKDRYNAEAVDDYSLRWNFNIGIGHPF